MKPRRKIDKLKTTKLNYKNWGVKDYTDKGDFNSAFSIARQAGEKEFMWNNKRYSVTIKNLPGERIKEIYDLSVKLYYQYGDDNMKARGHPGIMGWNSDENPINIDYYALLGSIETLKQIAEKLKI